MKTFVHTADTSDEGRLIKRVIRARMGLSHRQFSRIKAASGLLLDGEPVHANAIVHAGQTITVTLVEAGGFHAAADPHPVSIVYEDDELLIIDKEAPLPCQSSPHQSDATLENRLAAYFADEPDYVFRPVNRLDKGTSGLMCVAMNAHAQMILSASLHTPAFVREYLAVTDGIPAIPGGVIDAPIGKADGATIRRVVRPDGKPARTYYETLRVSGGRALLRLRLDTGRTHQIRVHLASIGCPVFGDFLYGTEKAELPGRFALHSAHIALPHPVTGASCAFDAPLPDALSRLL